MRHHVPLFYEDKKMVDGKGGSLKTIHHYKTERGLMTEPPFRLFLGSGWSGENRITIHRFTKKKTMTATV